MTIESTQQRKAREFKARIAEREAKALRFMERQWRHSLKLIQADIAKLTTRIELARENGERVNPDWLRRQGEYARLQNTIIAEGDAYGKDVGNRLRADVSWSANQAAANYPVLTELGFDLKAVPEYVRVQINFNQLDTKVVDSVAARIAPRTPTGKIIGKLGREAAKESRKVLLDGITRGKNVRVIARELGKAANLPRNRALTITRTEIFGAYTDTAHESMKANRKLLDGWIWHAELTGCCGGCLAMHGTVHDIDTFMKKHPNCRCEPMPKTKSFADLGLPAELDVTTAPSVFQPEAMRAEAEGILSNSSFKDLRTRFGTGKAQLIESGKVSIDDLAKVTTNRTFGGSTVETPLKDLLALGK